MTITWVVALLIVGTVFCAITLGSSLHKPLSLEEFIEKAEIPNGYSLMPQFRNASLAIRMLKSLNHVNTDAEIEDEISEARRLARQVQWKAIIGVRDRVAADYGAMIDSVVNICNWVRPDLVEKVEVLL